MIDDAVLFLSESLKTYINTKKNSNELSYIDERNTTVISDYNPKSIDLEKGRVNTLLINLESEYTFRSGAAYNNKKHPNLYLNLYILFVPYFNDYIQSLEVLSLVIQFFQNNNSFNHQNSPELSPEIEKLIMEMVNLPFSEQRDIWSGLGLFYFPSVIYKVRMLVFTDKNKGLK